MVDRQQSITMSRIVAGVIDVVSDWRSWSIGPSALMAGLCPPPTGSGLALDIARLRALASLGGDLSDAEMAEGREVSRRLLEAMVDDPSQAMATSLGEKGVEIMRPVMAPLQEERDMLIAHRKP